MKLHKPVRLLSVCCFTAAMVGCTLGSGDSSSAPETKTFSSLFLTGIDHVDFTNNRVEKLIAKETGATCVETWVEETANADDIVDELVISGQYPDFIYSDQNHHQQLLEADAFVPIDEYWDNCENLKNYFTEDEWDRIRDEDGHIYIVPSFSKLYLYDTDTIHDEEAFWIQVRVLKWADYPEIVTLDDYFDLLGRYLKANPIGRNGKPNIGYEILTDDWLYFCLENPPQFLDGYPNDGCCMVDPERLEALDYNTTPTAKRWFQTLNKAYRSGIVDPDCFVMTSEQYFDKLEEGNVLGMVDQNWNFGDHVRNLPNDCQYVPLGIVIDKGIEEHYHNGTALDTSQGMGVSVNCGDPEGAVKFINDLLSPEVLKLRFWGEAEVDYCIDEEGIFYLTDAQRGRLNDDALYDRERCPYSYFPFYKGMLHDGINAYSPTYQPTEFFKMLNSTMQECLSAYGARTYVELLNKSEPIPSWFPMWAYSNSFTPDTPYGKAKADMDSIKHQYLPMVVMSDNFEESWATYMDAYETTCDVDAYLTELTAEIRRRCAQ